MKTVYIGLGSNIGDKVGYIQQAYKMIKFLENVSVENFSSLYETEPYGNTNQDWFVNAVLEIKTSIDPEQLIGEFQRIEYQLGRNRSKNEKWSPRTIDIDILFYGDDIVSSGTITVPHCELHKRAFVLVPMLELNPDFVHPIIGKTIAEMHNDLAEPEEVYLYGTRV